MLHIDQLRERTVANLMQIAKAVRGDVSNPMKEAMISNVCTVLLEKGTSLPDRFWEVKNPESLEEPAVSDVSTIVTTEVHTEVSIARRYLQTYESARKRDIEFDLTISDVRRLMSRKRCAYTGIKFDDTAKNKLTFERKDNKKGYSKDNVVPVCHFANQLKSEMVENTMGRFYMEPATAAKFMSKALVEYL